MRPESILLQNISPEDLKQLISEAVEEKLIQFQPQQAKNTKYLTRKETSELLKISLPTLNEYTKSGKVKGHRIGGRVLYLESDIEQSLTEIETFKYKRS